MAERRHHAEELSRYWDALTAGEATPDPGELDPAEAAFVHTMVSHARRAQFPAGARERAREASLRQFAITQAHHSNGGTAMLSTAFPASAPLAPPRPFVPRPARPNLGRWQTALSYAGVAALILAMIGGIVFTYHNRHETPVNQTAPSPAASPATTPAHAWPMWGGNPAHTRVTADPGPQGAPVVLWSDSPSEAVPQVNIDRGAIADGVIYGTSSAGAGVYAVDAATGKLLWQVDGYGDSVLVDGDGLIVHGKPGSDSGDLVRLSRADGHVIWTAEQGKIKAAWNANLADGVGYMPSGNDLIAFDPATGAVEWRTPLASPASRGAAISDRVAVLGDEHGTIYGISLASHQAIWTYMTDATTITHPTIANGLAYFNASGGAQESYDAVDLASGELKWRFVAPSGVGSQTAAVDATGVYLPGHDGVLRALDPLTGALKWSLQAGSATVDSSALADGTLYFCASDGKAYAVDAANGSTRWTFPLDSASGTATIVVDGVAYFTSVKGTLYAIAGSGTATTAPAATPTVEASNANAAPVSFVWASSGDAQHKLVTPGLVAIDSFGRLWVSSMPGSFFVFDLDGNLLDTWGSLGIGAGAFNFTDQNGNTWGTVAFAPDGGFYVADYGNFRVQQFDKNRTFVRSWGQKGTGDGEFQMGPGPIAVDRQGNVLVADDGNNLIQRFTPDGRFINKFGGTGSGPGQFNTVGMITVAPDGKLWIADIGNNRIQVLNPDGTFAFAFGSAGDGDGRFNGPSQVAFDGNRHVFVTDQTNNLVQVFDLAGHFLYQFGGFGSGDGQFNTPASIVINHGTTAIVVDWKNGRIEKFKITGPFPAPAATPTP